jgi:hypothetical protein
VFLKLNHLILFALLRLKTYIYHDQPHAEAPRKILQDRFDTFLIQED